MMNDDKIKQLQEDYDNMLSKLFEMFSPPIKKVSKCIKQNLDRLLDYSKKLKLSSNEKSIEEECLPNSMEETPTNDYLPQIYTIEEKAPLFEYEINSQKANEILETVKDLQPIKNFIDSNLEFNPKITKDFSKILNDANKISISGLENDEYSKKLSGSVGKIVKKLVKNILVISIQHKIKAEREQISKEIEYYSKLIESLEEYFRSINVYTFSCPCNANYLDDEDVSIYFDSECYPIATSNSNSDGIIRNIEYPAHILKYFDEYGNQEYEIIEGKCSYYCN